MHKAAGAVLAFAGFILFGFGMYIIPFGTDIYLYFWVNDVFHGNWLYGSIAGNLFALLLIIIGLVFLHKAGKEPRLLDRETSKKSKRGGRRK